MKFVYRIKQIILAGGDLLFYILAFWLSLIIRHGQLPNIETLQKHSGLFVVLFLFWILINFINGLYDLKSTYTAKSYKRVLEAGIMSLILSILLLYLLPKGDITPKTILLLNILIGYSFSSLWRAVYDRLIGSKKLLKKVVIVGYEEEIKHLFQIIERHPEKGYKITAICDPSGKIKNSDFPGSVSIYRSLKALRPAISTHKADIIVTAPGIKTQEGVLTELYELLFWPVQNIDFSEFYEIVTGRIPPSIFSETWFLNNLRKKEQAIYNKFRRLLDYLAAIVLLIFLISIFPFIALSIKLSSKGQIFFKQERVGEFGKIFWIYKFRTMYALAPDGSAEKEGKPEFAQKDDKRITKIGKILRKTRLDELPQVINLIKGDLSLIGPRPERPQIVEELTEKMPYYALRHIVKPGITGWAAIHQNYTDTMKTSQDKLQYDLYYIKNRSFLLDLSIVLRTVNVVLRMMGQ